jgi:DNA-binding IclR family transcriptional regulator
MTTCPDTLRDIVEPARIRPPSDLVRSVSRAFAVLEAVGTAGAPLAAKAIARRIGVNLSTTYHLLHTLCWEGYLLRLPSGDFCLGAGISSRYRDLVSALGAPGPMREVLHRLTAVTGHTGYLGRLIEGRVALTDVVPGPGTFWTEDLAPGFDEISATPLGQVLLGAAVPPGPPATPGAGLVVEDGRPRADLSCAAVPVRRTVRGTGEAIRWAVGLTGPRGSFSGGAPALRALVRAGAELAVLDLGGAPASMTSAQGSSVAGGDRGALDNPLDCSPSRSRPG